MIIIIPFFFHFPRRKVVVNSFTITRAPYPDQRKTCRKIHTHAQNKNMLARANSFNNSAIGKLHQRTKHRKS